jgi:hypothetical protein
MTIRRAVRTALGVSLIALGLSQAEAQGPRPTTRTLLVVVNLKRPESDLPLHALSRFFRGEQRFWENGDRAYPVLPPEDIPEARASFLASVVKLDQRGFTLLWRNLVFRGDVTDQPISPPDERRAVQSVFAERGAIAIVEGHAIKNLDRVAKILTVNGRSRDDADYPLKW